jgi:uncharacterized RDD family membrane protein YckC
MDTPDVVSGEAVIIEVPVASFPSRMAAILIDIAVQGTTFGVGLFILGKAFPSLSTAAAAAVSVSVVVAVLIGYPVVFETLSRGRSVGKLALGLRVVSDDGGPERFRQALVRALVALIEIWGMSGAPALITSLLSAKGKRLGDLAAGTFVIKERLPARRTPPVMMPPGLESWAATLEFSALPDQVATAAASYLARYHELTPAARDQLGYQLAADVAARVSPLPPPGVPPAAYLAAILAERRARAQSRLAPRPPG